MTLSKVAERPRPYPVSCDTAAISLRLILWPVFLALALLALACQTEATPSTPTPAATTPPPTATASPSPTATVPPATATPIPTPTPTPRPTATPVPTPTPVPSPLANLEDGPLLEESDPAAARAIKALPWVMDGLEPAEGEDVELLIDFALAHPDVFSVLVSKPWIDDGISNEDSIINDLGEVANYSPAGAVEILQSGILDTTVVTRRSFIRYLSILAEADTEVFRVILQLPWLQGGIESHQQIIIRDLSSIAEAHPDLLASVAGLPILAAGDSETAQIFTDLRWVARNEWSLFSRAMQNETFRSALARDTAAVAENIEPIARFVDTQPELFEMVWTMPWLADGLGPDEWDVVVQIGSLGELVPENAGAILELLNVAAVGTSERAIVADLERMAKADPALVDLVLAMPRVSDGLEADELSVVARLAAFAELAPDHADQVAQLPFLETVEPEDGEYLATLEQKARTNSAGFRTIMDDPHLERTTERDVGEIENDLYWIRRYQQDGRSTTTAEQVSDLAFLETHDAVDVLAIESMRRLARNGDLAPILDHPALQDGIADAEAKIVTTLRGVNKYKPELIDTLLDPDQVLIEDRVIRLPRSGDVLLTIIRTRPGRAESMDLLEHAVRTVEEFMDVPMPTNYIAYLFEDAVEHTVSDVAGRHFGTHIASEPWVDQDGDRRARYAVGHIAHEVAHYYWRSDENWIDEGGADFMSIVSENARVGSPIEPDRNSREEFQNIQELVRWEEKEEPDDTHTCNYRLGQRFFLDMYHTIGEEAFRRGIRNYYLGEAEGLSGIKAAFQKDAITKIFNDVDTVIARWYYGTEPRNTE